MIANYRRDFELLSTPLHDLPMEVLESTFIKGLKPDVKIELRIMRQSGLGQIMELTQLIEDCNVIMRGIREPAGPLVGGSIMTRNGKPKEGFQTRAMAIGDRPSSQCKDAPPKCLSESN